MNSRGYRTLMSAMNYLITDHVLEDDLNSVIEIEELVFGPFGTNNPPEIIRLQQKTFTEGFIVARHQNGIVGYSSSEKWEEMRSPRMGENPEDTHSSSGQVFCITTMAVKHEHRGFGIGTSMLSYQTDLAKKSRCHTMIVETPRTRSFYEKHGFTLLRMEEDKGLDTAILTKSINVT